MTKILIVACALLFGVELKAAEKSNNKTRVCIIGAGVGGLTSARYLKDEGIDFIVIESTKYVGGTWRYTEEVGLDEYGLPIHTSMYKHLRTNLPKVSMELPDFPMPVDTPSFLTWDIYYNYLQAYAEHFDLRRHIKFLHQATSVNRKENNWRVKYKYVPTGEEFEEYFDYMIVATGHHSKPNMPNIPGENIFQGKIIHSHDFRVLEPFKCRRVLVIGAGPSGMDIGLDVATVSKTLVHSHHSMFPMRTPFPSNYIMKPDVKELNQTGAVFVDGTFEEIDDIIYCTGFEYYYPFLDESSGLTITARGVTPLHKNLLNIYQPTMVLMGLIIRAGIVIALDAQARYAVALAKGAFQPPSREAMLQELQSRYEDLSLKGHPWWHFQILGPKEDQYYAELTKESGIQRVKPVISKIHAVNADAMFANFNTFRNYEYEIIDDETFTRTYTDVPLPPRSGNCSRQN